MTRYSEEEKTKHLEDWKKGGKSARAYARENGINGQTFGKWTKREDGTGFVEVKQAGNRASVNEIPIEKGDLKIRLPLSMGEAELRMVFQTIGSLV
jgi:transposase-like protein